MIMLCFHDENSPELPKYRDIYMGDYDELVDTLCRAKGGIEKMAGVTKFI